MKNITLVFAVSFLLSVLAACNAKQEKKIEADTDSIVKTDDYDDFEFEEDSITAEPDTVSKTEENKTEEPTDKTDENKPDEKKSEPVMEEKEDGSLSEVSEEELKKEEEKQKANPKKEHVKKFYIIAGSFQNINNAVDLRAYLKSQGFPAMVLYPYRGYNRVAVKSFNTRKEAEKEIAVVRTKNLNYKDEDLEYWLLWR
jgi:cell division protein FtsN